MMNKKAGHPVTEEIIERSEVGVANRAVKTIRALSLILTLILFAFACSAAPELAPVAGEQEVETSPGEPPQSEPIQQTALAPTEVASAEGELPEDAPPGESSKQPAEELNINTVFPERRLLTLERPARIRVGDSEVVRIVIEVDERGNITPTAFFEENEIEVKPVEILNLYDTHIIRAEARLEMAGIQVAPSGSIDRRLNAGETVEFSWSVIPDHTGSFKGNVWVFLRYIPKGEGETIEKTLFSQPVEFQAVNLLGLGGSSARWLGAVGSLVTSLFGLDDLVKWIRRGRKGRAAVA